MSTKASDRAKITEKAEHYVKAGKIEEAVAEYQKLLDGSGQDISIGNIIGDLCLQLGQEDRAVQLFLANVETLERRGAYSQALAIAKKVNKIRPSRPDRDGPAGGPLRPTGILDRSPGRIRPGGRRARKAQRDQAADRPL